MTENTALKIVISIYFFLLSFTVFYIIDILVQYAFVNEISWTKYISSAFSHALMIAFGAVQGWNLCKDWYEGN